MLNPYPVNVIKKSSPFHITFVPNTGAVNTNGKGRGERKTLYAEPATKPGGI
jgi:hypothetical protein